MSIKFIRENETTYEFFPIINGGISIDHITSPSDLGKVAPIERIYRQKIEIENFEIEIWEYKPSLMHGDYSARELWIYLKGRDKNRCLFLGSIDAEGNHGWPHKSITDVQSQNMFDQILNKMHKIWALMET